MNPKLYVAILGGNQSLYISSVYISTCHNKVPQAEWFRTTETTSLTVLEAGSLKSRCWQGYIPPKALEKASSLALPSFWWLSEGLGISWFAVVTQISASTLCALGLHVVFSSLCVCAQMYFLEGH